MIEPRLKRQFFGTVVVAESPRDDLIHHLGSGETVIRTEDLLIGAPKEKFPIHETLKPRKIRIHIRADVIRRNGRR